MEESFLQSFEFMPGTKIRAFVHDGDIWFILKDVGHAIGVKRFQWRRSVAYVIERYTHMDSVTQPRCRKLHEMHRSFEGLVPTTLCVNESMLYIFLMRSDKPAAMNFQNWLASEVIPAIRKEGRYELPNSRLTADAERTLTNRADVKSGVVHSINFNLQCVGNCGEVTLLIKGNELMPSDQMNAMKSLASKLCAIITGMINL